MAKRKTSTSSIVAEPAATYARKAERTWRFKRLSQEDLLEQARKPMTMPALKRRVQENPFAEVAYAGLLQTSVAGLRALMRTSKSLVPAQTELVLLYEQTMARGVEVFGNEEKFQRWLELRIPALEHKRPKELMTTFTGIRLVADELETIAHGVFA
ncbi:MAG TPA: MbcA/ParS/Xre antitoxin family protein [Flavobacteriales bacterium]|nr:MbcA/ParS/Xre antitoxin family protein [Flavobacteriales bacterium]HMR28844.1 MbcA/ParS/Xre antitoxin family protein [Flavobacteriales bacterium]